MGLGEAVADYSEARERVRWMTDVRLRLMERKAGLRARAGRLGVHDVVRLAAVRDELAARGLRPRPIHGRHP